MKRPKFVTLTLRMGKDITRIERLKKIVEFARRTRYYLGRRHGYKIRSFVQAVEYPNHVHCVWDTAYIPRSQLSEIWETVTKDSFIVDIKQVTDVEKAIGYITNYISKITAWGGAQAWELKHFDGLHLTGSWGPMATGWKAKPFKCRCCGSRTDAAGDLPPNIRPWDLSLDRDTWDQPPPWVGALDWVDSFETTGHYDHNGIEKMKQRKDIPPPPKDSDSRIDAATDHEYHRCLWCGRRRTKSTQPCDHCGDHKFISEVDHGRT